TQLLITQKEEAGIQLQAKEFNLMAAAADLDKIEEVNVNCILMANLQQASTPGTQTDKARVYDLDGPAEQQVRQTSVESPNLEKPNPPIVTMADNRTMAQLLEAPTEGYEDAIVIPEITANNFEIKHGLLNLVQNKQFFGHDKEDPHAPHLIFQQDHSTTKFPNVPRIQSLSYAFHFPSREQPRIWLDKEPPQSILTWDDLVSKFICQILSPFYKYKSLK
ncbi:hypothetical protein Tco_0097248, partial [Tanacetum coccineum]